MSDTPAPSEEARLATDRLDEETENAIQAYVSAAINAHDATVEENPNERTYRTEEISAKSRLDARIRTLIEEARESAIRITENAWRTR